MTVPARKAISDSLRPAKIQRSIFWMGDIVIVKFPRVANGAQTDQLAKQLERDIRERFPRGFIFDALGTDTYTVDVRAAGARLLSILARAGADRGCCVTRHSSIRMIGTAVAFVAGVNVEFKQSMQDALDHLGE